MRGFITMAGCMMVGALAVGLAGAPAAQAEDASKNVTQLLNLLNDAFLHKDVDLIQRLMSDDHVVITSSGQRRTKEESLKALADLKLTEYAVEDVKIATPTKEMAMVTYRATVQGTFKGKDLPPKMTVASVWAHRNGKWLEVLYQETPLEAR